MDRISDSGSDDWGSTPHGRTTIPPKQQPPPRLLLFSFPTAALQPSLQPHFPLKVVNDLKDFKDLNDLQTLKIQSLAPSPQIPQKHKKSRSNQL